MNFSYFYADCCLLKTRHDAYYQPAKADPQVLKNDQAAFRNASLWAFGAGIASVAGMSYIGRKWHLAYRIPAVSFVGFTCFGAANLYSTKNAIEGQFRSIELA